MGSLKALGDALVGELISSLPVAPPGSRAELRELYALVADYPARGGKHLRGLLLMLSCLAHGGRAHDALPVAVALELLQNWVLVHDDIEDDSDIRRGQPALHKQVGMPIALNAGDVLHVHMWEYLAERSAHLPRHEAIRRTLSQVILRTAEGQHLDLSWVASGRFDVSAADYLEMVTLKTAHYTVIAPLCLGALCADCAPDPRFEEAGRSLGVAFQIRDDVLNLTHGEGYGKEFAGDLYEAKRTLILARAWERSSASERARLRALLGKPRAQRTAEDVNEVLALIRRHGALEYAQGVAEAEAERGLELVRAAAAGLAEQSVAAELTGLLESLAQRSR